MARLIVLPLLLLCAAGAGIAPATAPATQAAAAAAPSGRVRLSVATVTEEGKQFLRASVTLDDKAVENVTVAFLVKRKFGNLLLGEDKTLDDGTAAVALPADLPGGPNGELGVVVRVTSPESYATLIEQVVPGGAPFVGGAEVESRALWASHAPIALVAAIVLLVGGVWAAYTFVVVQIIGIRRAAGR